MRTLPACFSPRRYRSAIGLTWGLLWVLLAPLTTTAQTQPAASNSEVASSPTPEFRILSQTFVGDKDQPVARNITLFSQGHVYDFQYRQQETTPAEIVILDTRMRKMVLLDPARKLKLELADVQLLRILDSVRRSAEEDERTRFLVATDYQEEIDPDRRQVTLQGDQIRYTFDGIVPENPNVLPAYFEFLDSFTRLQASDPGKLPPFPRIRLNQSIRRVGWIPRRVEMQVQANAVFRTPFAAHTEHQLEEALTAEDRARISETRQQWAQYQGVSLAEFRGFAADPRTAGSRGPAEARSR